MEFEVSDISKIVPCKNYLLVRANKEEKYINVDGLALKIDPTYEPEQHAATCGEVIMPCEELDEHLESEVEVEVGETIFFHYLSIRNCIRDKKYAIANGIPYFFVSYGSVYCVKKLDGRILPLNKQLMVEPVEIIPQEKNEFGFFMPNTNMSKNHKNIGVVRYVNPRYTNLVKPGDEIFFAKNSWAPMQYELHNSLEGNKTFYRIPNELVLAKFQ